MFAISNRGWPAKNIFKTLFVIGFLLCFCRTNAQGLAFHSNESLVAERTSYHVFANDIPTFKKQLHINFELSLWDTIPGFGYVFILKGANYAYSFSYVVENDGAAYLNFNIDSKSNKIKVPIAPNLLRRNHWMKVNIDCDLVHDELSIIMNGRTYTAGQMQFPDIIQPNLIFGKNPSYTDVPDMSIRNLEISDGKTAYTFPLNEWSGADVHNTDHNTVGNVENALWLMPNSYLWKAQYSQSFADVAGLNFDSRTGNLFIFSHDSLITYGGDTKIRTAVPYKNKIPLSMVLGKSIFDSVENKCIVYDVFGVKPGEPSIASLNLADRSWQVIGRATYSSQLHHHNVFFDADRNISLFGGYGAFRYHDSILSYNRSLDKWQSQSFSGDSITPRFFSAIGPADKPGELFLFGGYGNQTGNQVIGGKQYYDLYRINLLNHTIKKCWSIQPDSGVFVPANNLILSKDKQFFYALCYPHEVAKTELRLYKFSVKDGSYEVVSSAIPVTSERIESDINLFYYPNTFEFLCAIQEFSSPTNSTVKIFSLESPPVSRVRYLNSLNPPGRQASKIFYFIAFTVLVAGAIGSIIFLRAKSLKRERSITPVVPSTLLATTPSIPTAQVSELTDSEEQPEFIRQEKNAVYLLGEFFVFDKTGMDITHLFSPKIKQLFVLILLFSKDGHGISSKKISTLLWPEKDVAKTKNIKGVTFNHLRNIIRDISGLELTFENDNYLFTHDERFFCDYYFLSGVFIEPVSLDIIKKNLPFILRGSFVTSLHEPWLDEFKYAYEDRLTSKLMPELENLYNQKCFKIVFDLSKLLLDLNPFDEAALKHLLRSVMRLKGRDAAIKQYEHFATEYTQSLGLPFETSFESLIH